MYKGHSMLGGARRKPVPGMSFSREKKKCPELSGVQLKEINSCEENDLETPHTHTEGFQQTLKKS